MSNGFWNTKEKVKYAWFDLKLSQIDGPRKRDKRKVNAEGKGGRSLEKIMAHKNKNNGGRNAKIRNLVSWTAVVMKAILRKRNEKGGNSSELLKFSAI